MRNCTSRVVLVQILFSVAVNAVAVTQVHSEINSTTAAMKSQTTKSFSASPGRIALPNQASVFDSAQVEWLREYSSSALKGHAEGMAVATDPQGNFYIAGKAERSSSSYDYLTIKYSSNGVELWSAWYDGPVHGIDIANAVAVDANGNVYVTGLSSGGNSGYDYATLKYTATGQEQWVARYDGPGNAGDAASGVVVDVDGNVFVTGESARAKAWIWSDNYDLATIKYNSLGVQQWVDRYDGLAHTDDQPVGIALDSIGNAYVVGQSCDSIRNIPNYGSQLFFSTAVMKYSSGGNREWTVRYMPADSIAAIPLDFSVHELGDVVVTGYTSQVLPGPWWNSSTTKCMTVRFTASGVLQWSSFYQDPHSQHAGGARVATDQEGNIYVAGAIGGRPYNPFVGNDSLFLSKYDQNGQLQWVSAINDTAFSYLKPVDVVLDPTGSPYLTWTRAQSYYDAVYAAMYSPNGHEEWRVSYDQRHEPPYSNRLTAQAIVSDANGNLHIVGGTGGNQGTDVLMLKYAPNGIRKWVHTETCTRSWDQIYAMAVDDSNNVYVTGTSNTGAWASDILTIKYSSSGEAQWYTRYSGSFQSRNIPSALEVDQAGNVLVLATGDSTDWSSGRRSHFLTIKYNVSGHQQWVATYRGPSTNDESYAIDMAMDASSNVIVAGYGSANNQREYVTIKYDPAGVQQWVARYDTSNWDEGTTAIAVDDSGAVIVGTTYRVIKYNNAGSLIWVYPEGATDVAVDGLGNIYLTHEERMTKKLSRGGSVQWSIPFSGNAIVLDASWNVLVRDLWGKVGKITAAGSVLWSVSATDYRIGSSLAVDGVGNVYVGEAHQTSSSSYSEYHIRALSTSGALLWSTGFEDEGTTSWYHYPLAVSGSGEVFVGAGIQSGSSSVYRTIKYRQVATSVKDEENEIPKGYSLFQNYPNPFNPSTTIQFALPRSGHVELKVYNTLGQEVTTLVSEEKNAGTYSTQWNAGSASSGVYFYRLKAGEYLETKKLLLMK